jgi:hypothetical protein
MFEEKLALKISCSLIFCAFAGGLAAVPNPVATVSLAVMTFGSKQIGG